MGTYKMMASPAARAVLVARRIRKGQQEGRGFSSCLLATVNSRAESLIAPTTSASRSPSAFKEVYSNFHDDHDDDVDDDDGWGLESVWKKRLAYEMLKQLQPRGCRRSARHTRRFELRTAPGKKSEI
eukprot:5084019-Amphidinium_carterae.1